jgi:hypothetical protein
MQQKAVIALTIILYLPNNMEKILFTNTPIVFKQLSKNENSGFLIAVGVFPVRFGNRRNPINHF